MGMSMNRNDRFLLIAGLAILIMGVQYSEWKKARQAAAQTAAVEKSQAAAAARLPEVWARQRDGVMALARQRMEESRYAEVLAVLEPWDAVLSPEERGFRNAARRLLAQEQEALSEAPKVTTDAGWKPVRSQWDGTYAPVVEWVRRMSGQGNAVRFRGCTPAVIVLGKWKTTCRWTVTTPLGLTMDETLSFLMVDGAIVETF
jgi:hypothetical protein